MSNKEYYNQIDAYKIGNSPAHRQYIQKFQKKYQRFLHDKMNENPLLKAYYVERKSIKTLADIYGVDEGIMQRKIKYEREALKIECLENGFTSYIARNQKTDDVCKYTENMIAKNGLLRTIYELGNDPLDIAEILEIDRKSIDYAINKTLKNKEKLLIDLGVESPWACIEAVKYYFPNLLIDIEKLDTNYFKIINSVIDSNEVLTKYFKEGKRKKVIMEEINKSLEYIQGWLKYGKGKIVEMYEHYKKYNSIEPLPISLSKQVLNQKTNDFVNIRNEEKEKYIRFTAYYFPELIGQMENLPKEYFMFVDEFVIKDEVYTKYFALGEKQSDIARDLGVTRQSINYKLSTSKKNMQKQKIITKR